jgi:hypothetical protein
MTRQLATLLKDLLKARDPRARFLPRAMFGAVLLHTILAIVVITAAPYWPDSFAAALQAKLPGLTDVFAHTPRVETLLEQGDVAGDPPETREARRLDYAVSHLIIALGLVATLAGFALLLLRGIRDPSYSIRMRNLARPETDPVLHLAIAGLSATLAAGAAALLYFGFVTNAQDLKGDLLIPLVAFIDLLLLLWLATFAALLHRVLVRPAP